MNTKFSKMKTALAVCAIILVLYVLAFLLIPFPKDATAWVVFGFTVLAIITALFVTAKAYAGVDFKNAIFAYPVFRMGLWLVALQLISGTIICVVNCFTAVPMWVAIVVSALLFGLMLVGVIMTSAARNMVVAVEKQTQEKIKNVNFFRVDVRNLKNLCENDDVLPALCELADLFEYSTDPVSNEQTAPLEEAIRTALEELRAMLPVEGTQPLLVKVKEIKNMLLHRNDVCKASK